MIQHGAPGQPRTVAMWLHSARPSAAELAIDLIKRLARHQIRALVAPDRYAEISARVPGITVGTLSDADDDPPELMVVLGGDGTILSAVEWSLPRGIPLLGVNMGHVGFLAELEYAEAAGLVDQIVGRDYKVEERMLLQVEIRDPSDTVLWTSFALNELSIEKVRGLKMIDVLVSVDRRPLSRWNCDGVLVSTPTGSTAYAFSAGGPVIWPDVEAIELVPLLAHALFARPVVLSPSSLLEIRLSPETGNAALALCDGRRSADLPPGHRAVVTRNPSTLRLARLQEQPFTTRLVKKFELPVYGWRQH